MPDKMTRTHFIASSFPHSHATHSERSVAMFFKIGRASSGAVILIQIYKKSIKMSIKMPAPVGGPLRTARENPDRGIMNGNNTGGDWHEKIIG